MKCPLCKLGTLHIIRPMYECFEIEITPSKYPSLRQISCGEFIDEGGDVNRKHFIECNRCNIKINIQQIDVIDGKIFFLLSPIITALMGEDDDGFIEVPVIIEESGMFVGGAPAALRIHEIGVYDEDDFNKAYVARLNRRTDLPFYLATAKIKIVGEMKKFTDDDLVDLHIAPLDDR